MAAQGQPRYAFRTSCSGEVRVMAGPGDEIAAGAGSRGHLRASHADREQVIGTLKAAFVQGRLAKDEFDLRVSQTFASRTCAELAAVTADLPAGLAAAQPPEPARESANKKKESSRGACLRDIRVDRHSVRTAADTGRAFCRIGRAAHVRLDRGRVDRLASAIPRM